MPDGSQHVSRTIYASDAIGINNNTFMSGNGWFVSTRYDPAATGNATAPTTPGKTVQSLSLNYIDWSGNHWTAERVTDPANGHQMFVVTPRDEANALACEKGADGKTPCATDTIQFQIPNGSNTPINATAQIVPAASLRPTTYVTYSTPVNAGTPVAFTAHADAGNPNNANLTYTWTLPSQWYGGTLVCTGDINHPVCTTNFTGPTPSFTFTIPGLYQGALTATNPAGYSTTSSFSVNVQDTVHVGIATSANPAAWGQKLNVTATVTPDVTGGNPLFLYPKVRGEVQFFLDGHPYGDSVIATQRQGVINDPASDATIELPADLAPGNHIVAAVYFGTGPYKGNGNGLAFEVDKADTAPTITASASPTVFGQAVTFTAYVDPIAPGAGLPTGTVQFTADGQPLGAPVALDAAGAATSPSISTLGPHFGPFTLTNVRAFYSGDDHFEARIGGLDHEVDPAPTHTTVTSSANPSVYGRETTFTATVTVDPPSTASPPTGPVQFLIDGSPVGQPVGLDSSGQASFTTGKTQLAATGAGTSFPDGHAITAQYLGDTLCVGCLVPRVRGEHRAAHAAGDARPGTADDAGVGERDGGRRRLVPVGRPGDAHPVRRPRRERRGHDLLRGRQRRLCSGHPGELHRLRSAVPGTGNGVHTVTYFSDDFAGNDEALRTATIRIDATPPTTAIALSTPDVNGWYTFGASILATAGDGGSSSGVADTRCQLDIPASGNYSDLNPGCNYVIPGAWVTSEGIHTLYAASKDTAGNKEAVQSITFKIDKTPPVASVGALATFQGAATFPVSWSGTDNLSGVKNYDVRYRQAASNGSFGGYTTWFSHTTSTSALFTAAAGIDDLLLGARDRQRRLDAVRLVGRAVHHRCRSTTRRSAASASGRRSTAPATTGRASAAPPRPATGSRASMRGQHDRRARHQAARRRARSSCAGTARPSSAPACRQARCRSSSCSPSRCRASRPARSRSSRPATAPPTSTRPAPTRPADQSDGGPGKTRSPAVQS